MAAPATEAYEFTADASIYGTVTMDNETDNSYRTIYIQDATSAIAVFFKSGQGGVYIGDSIRIYLKDLIVMHVITSYSIHYTKLYDLVTECSVFLFLVAIYTLLSMIDR